MWRFNLYAIWTYGFNPCSCLKYFYSSFEGLSSPLLIASCCSVTTCRPMTIRDYIKLRNIHKRPMDSVHIPLTTLTSRWKLTSSHWKLTSSVPFGHTQPLYVIQRFQCTQQRHTAPEHTSSSNIKSLYQNFSSDVKSEQVAEHLVARIDVNITKCDTISVGNSSKSTYTNNSTNPFVRHVRAQPHQMKYVAI